MVKIFELDTNRFLLELSDDEFSLLAEELEEESLDDDDYYLHISEVEFMEERGNNPELVAKLRTLFEGREDLEIRFQRVS
ncbi:MAG: hypothetical protein V2A54_01290 [Bacteroidota bacterium]